jgi:uncharacterized repeat protein (TIGR01451 family)
MRFFARFTRVPVLCLSSILLVAQVCATPSAVVPSPARAATLFQNTVEYITVYAGDCVTPQTVFNLGDVVCAEAGGFAAPLAERSRRFYWSAPGSLVPDTSDITVDPDYTRFRIPDTGDFARVGTWHVATVNPDANREVRARFIVRNPKIRFADIVLEKWGPPYVDPGDRVIYRVRIQNPGPDFAELIEINDEVPNEMTFLAFKQASGPELSCRTPGQGQTGTSTCFAKGLEPGEKIEILFYYVVNRDVSGRPFFTSAEAFSQTEELNKFDNSWTYTSTLTFNEEAETGGVEDP